MSLTVRGAALAALAAAWAADVAPSCGTCQGGPRTTLSGVWEDCGHHGPRHTLQCTTGTACFDMQTSENRFRCTIACSSDTDCKKLGSEFTCTGRALPYGSSDGERSVCAKGSAADASVP